MVQKYAQIIFENKKKDMFQTPFERNQSKNENIQHNI